MKTNFVSEFSHRQVVTWSALVPNWLKGSVASNVILGAPMALVACRECKQQVSTEAPVCPQCGAPQPAQSTWKGFGFEWKSQTEIWGYPFVHIAFGRDASGRRRVAKGVIAIGQFGVGLITFAQVGVGLLFGFGQVLFGLTAIAQVAITALFGAGQLAVGYVAVGQLAVGVYALAQYGFAEHLWTPQMRDPEAVEFFRGLWEQVRSVFNSWGN